MNILVSEKLTFNTMAHYIMETNDSINDQYRNPNISWKQNKKNKNQPKVKSMQMNCKKCKNINLKVCICHTLSNNCINWIID